MCLHAPRVFLPPSRTLRHQPRAPSDLAAAIYEHVPRFVASSRPSKARITAFGPVEPNAHWSSTACQTTANRSSIRHLSAVSGRAFIRRESRWRFNRSFEWEMIPENQYGYGAQGFKGRMLRRDCGRGIIMTIVSAYTGDFDGWGSAAVRSRAPFWQVPAISRVAYSRELLPFENFRVRRGDQVSGTTGQGSRPCEAEQSSRGGDLLYHPTGATDRIPNGR